MRCLEHSLDTYKRIDHSHMHLPDQISVVLVSNEQRPYVWVVLFAN